MAALIPDEKCLVLVHKEAFCERKYTTGCHPGPVAPSAAEGTLLSSYNTTLKDCYTEESRVLANQLERLAGLRQLRQLMFPKDVCLFGLLRLRVNIARFNDEVVCTLWLCLNSRF